MGTEACGPTRYAVAPGAAHPALAHDGPIVLDCEPPEGWSECVAVAVFIAAPPERVFALMTDLEGLGRFFPGMEFRRLTEGPLMRGFEYEAREAGDEEWARYRIVAFEPGRRMAAEQVEGIFEGFRYDHRLLPVDGGTISQEVVDYELPFGLLDPLVDVVYVEGRIRRDLIRAHGLLRAAAESAR